MPTIWITGGKGFIGRNLARHIAGESAAVFGIGHGFWTAQDAARWSFLHWMNGEIESSNLSRLAGVSGLPDTVFHLAGGSSVGASFQSPQEDFSRTVETTARLFEWIRVHSASTSVLCVSSAAVYGAGHSGRIPEGEPVAPYSPYGYNKSMMESISRSYGENFGLKVALVRLFSVYGAELEKQLIWDICRKLDARESEPPKLGGTGEELRDWIHVSDAVRLLWMAREACGARCPAFNGGTGRGIAVKDVAGTVCRAWSLPSIVSFSGIGRPGDPHSLIADTTRSKSLGFEPLMTFSRGIAEAVDWFRRNKSGTSRIDTLLPHAR